MLEVFNEIMDSVNDIDAPESHKLFLKSKISEMRKVVMLYQRALTKAVSLPKGVLPDDEQYYTWMANGNCTVERK